MTITLGIFIAVIAMTLAITWWAAKRTRTASHYYTAGGDLSAAQNGLALCGSWLSAAAFLGYTGLIALYGMDGAIYALGGLMAFGMIMLLVAEPLRNTGKFTIGDVINYRMRSRPALLAAVTGAIVINVAYIMPQMSSAGALVKLLTGISYEWAIVLVGLAMIVYVTFGGMLATTWVQIVKAVLLFIAAIVVLVLTLIIVHFDPLTLFRQAETRYGLKFLSPGNYLKHPLDGFSLALGFVFGGAGLPHVMTRFYTVKDAKTARRSVIWVMFLAGAFFVATTLFGLAAADFVGQDAIRAVDKGGNLALPLLAQFVGGGAGTTGGDIVLGVVAAVAFATTLAVVAALMLSTTGAIAHDFYVHWLKRGEVDPHKQVIVARISTAGIGLLSVLLGILAKDLNVAVLVILALCIAASANFPIIVLSLFWRRFNTGGVVGGVVVGLISSVALAMMGPGVQGAGATWPLINPAIVSMPLGFLGAIVGTLLWGRDLANEARFDEVLLRVHSGVHSGMAPVAAE